MIKGCLGIILIVVILNVVIRVGGCVYDAAKKKTGELNAWRDARLAEKTKQAEEERAKKEAAEKIAAEKRQREEAEAAARRRQEIKEDKLRTFALKDAPTVWNAYQALTSEIEVQGKKIEELRQTLATFGRDPEEDADFRRIRTMRDEMIRSRRSLHARLEDAYIAARKYEASPSRKDYQELHKKALEDGIKEADAATARFKEMRLNK